MINQFFKRTINKEELHKFEYEPFIQHTLKIKDVILFENDKVKFTLQDVIYNAYPKLYDIVDNDNNIKDKINFSINIQDFLDNCKDFDFKEVIYKDLNKNKFIKLTEKDILKKINETSLYKKINIRYQEKQLKLEKSNFINLYDLNINLPDDELLDYILKIKRTHKREHTEKNIDCNIDYEERYKLLNQNGRNRIKSFIIYKEKKQKKIESEKESIQTYKEFLKNYNQKKIIKKEIEDKDLFEGLKKFNELEILNSEMIEKSKREKNLKYKSYIYNPKKLADILFIYDFMENKNDDNTYEQFMTKAQYSLFTNRRKYINILEEEDLEGCNLSNTLISQIMELNSELFDLLNFNPPHEEINYTEFLKLIEDENLKKINEIMKEIYSRMNEKAKKRYLPYSPYISTRTLYKYHEIAKFYIEEENYKLLLD
ncbi:hypothetical protein [Arcobacter peruensis]|uniref:hypothetical protein n=1 Tax=Arcobacter peruensis TaxID=2320140 RepID=UPI000F0904C2|nr:hypothetical protein [Arcobacter peruensis]